MYFFSFRFNLMKLMQSQFCSNQDFDIVLNAQLISSCLQQQIVMIRLFRLARFTATTKPTADYYKILELDKTASAQQIKFAFYKLSQLYHPSISKSSEAKENFNLLNEAYVILSDVKSRRAYDLVHKIDPHTTVTPPARDPKPRQQTPYEKTRQEKNEEFKKRYNIDEFGRFRGGVPNKRKGMIRGTSLEQPGSFFSHIIHQDVVDTDPDYQYVTPQVAESFKKFHQDERQFRTFKWPWFNVEIDYQTFSGKRFLKWFSNVLIVLVVVYAIPTYFQVGSKLYYYHLENQQRQETIKALQLADEVRKASESEKKVDETTQKTEQ